MVRPRTVKSRRLTCDLWGPGGSLDYIINYNVTNGLWAAGKQGVLSPPRSLVAVAVAVACPVRRSAASSPAIVKRAHSDRGRRLVTPSLASPTSGYSRDQDPKQEQCKQKQRKHDASIPGGTQS
jgi:hypothetical protein